MSRLVLEDFAGDTLTVEESSTSTQPRLEFIFETPASGDDPFVALELPDVMGLHEFLGEWLAANR